MTRVWCGVAAEGKFVDATQEMVALGVCNIASSLVESMPVSGALSRGAVNHASGVATTAGGLYTGVLVLLALQVRLAHSFLCPRGIL
jgi:solute carrier family 26 (sodium-independent sulfate anion transporter), member 11